MPAALSVDWEGMKAAYVKGVPLPELARQYGVSYHAVRSRAHRYGWRTDAAAGASMLQQSAARTMADRGAHWGERMATIVERQLDYLESTNPGSLGAKDFNAFVDVLDRIDRIARRTFKLDDGQAQSAPPALVQVNVPTAIYASPIPFRKSGERADDMLGIEVE